MTSTDTTDSRSGAGLRARRRGRRLLAALAGVAAALVLGACAAGPASTPAPDPTYGSLPSFLPTTADQPDSTLTGTADRPALTTEGDGVLVRLGGGTVLATVSGPEVPGEGLPYVTPATTCTWTVTLTGASAPVPIRAADFTSLDHLGRVYRPALIAGRPKPPATVAPGRTVTFELRVVMVSGEGLMRWAPEGHIVASWDFEVEND